MPSDSRQPRSSFVVPYMSTWTVEEVSTRKELDAIAELMLNGSDDSRHLFFPIHNKDRAAALQNTEQRLWDEHINDPSSHWIYVRDSTNAASDEEEPLRVIGACQWRFYTSNPFEDGLPELDAVWWPQGGGRTFTNHFMQQVFVPRSVLMARPHSGMSWNAVLPEHRRRGIGTALMRWGVQRTDELGLESYIEATKLGARLYQSHSYTCINRFDFDMRGISDDAKYTELETKLNLGQFPQGFDAMWRPAGGKLEEGEPQNTWNERLKLLRC